MGYELRCRCNDCLCRIMFSRVCIFSEFLNMILAFDQCTHHSAQPVITLLA